MVFAKMTDTTRSNLPLSTESRTSHRTLRWVALLTLAIVLTRSILITHAHSEYWDDQYHLLRGLAMLDRTSAGLTFNDPPMGEWLEAIPLWIAGIHPHGPDAFGGDTKLQLANVIYRQRLSPESIRMIVVIWKSLLFVPAALIVFIWCRRLYSARAAWLALALVLIDPTIAGHIPTAALDVLGMEGILLACFAADAYLRKPSHQRAILAALASAAAMCLKHTGVITPAVVLLIMVIGSRQRETLRRIPLFILVTLLGIWAFTLFDISKPAAVLDPLLINATKHAWTHWTLPAGVYLGALANGLAHSHLGHRAFLFGQYSTSGWWYYYPVVALYKIPLGILLIFILILTLIPFSIREEIRIRMKIKIREKYQWIPLTCFSAWTILAIASHINIGFRHFLPAYLFLLMLISGVVASATTSFLISIILTISAFLQTLPFHPDYLSYVNFPNTKYWWTIGDSNVDWGQGMKQIDHWLAAHPRPGREVYLRRFTDPYGLGVRYYLGAQIQILSKFDPPPAHGLLIISMVHEGGAYTENSPYRALKSTPPDAIIGHSMLVYDLDRITAGRGMDWPRINETTRSSTVPVD